jgi:hypothetical protein
LPYTSLNSTYAHENILFIDGGMMPLFPTDAESLKAMKVVLDPTRDDDKMDGVQAISAAPSTAIGKNKRKKIGRK